MKILATLAAGVTLLALGSAVRADTLATWTFESSLPSGWTGVAGLTAQDAGPFAAEVGTGSASGHHASSLTVYAAPVGSNSSARSFTSNHWAVGDYYQFSTSSTGYENIAIGFDVQGSGTGPKNFKIAYSTDNSSYTDFNTYVVPSSFGHFSFDFSSIAALNNASTLYFRLIDNSTTSISNGTVGTGGTSRIDNVTVAGAVIPTPVPLPAASLAGSALLGLLPFARRRKTHA